jgi:AraC-like DNA-binding protein/quercetin dioxygenase-like cupin family protein
MPKTEKSQNYSFTDEIIPLDPEFPIFTFSFSVSHEPISNLHCHNVLELGICLKGYGIFIIDNAIHTYEANDVIAIGAGVYHRAKSGVGMEDLWRFLYFNPAEWNLPPIPQNIAKTISARDDPMLFPLLKMVTDEITDKPDDYRTCTRGLLNAIMVRLARLIHSATGKDDRPEQPAKIGDKRINEAIDIILEEGNTTCSIQEIAERCNISESHFRHLFREQVGMSPKHFQMKLQIKTAMTMLKDKNKRIVDIAEECGYESLSSFTRYFKEETGLSPMQWRAHED